MGLYGNRVGSNIEIVSRNGYNLIIEVGVCM